MPPCQPPGPVNVCRRQGCVSGKSRALVPTMYNSRPTSLRQSEQHKRESGAFRPERLFRRALERTDSARRTVAASHHMPCSRPERCGVARERRNSASPEGTGGMPSCTPRATLLCKPRMTLTWVSTSVAPGHYGEAKKTVAPMAAKAGVLWQDSIGHSTVAAAGSCGLSPPICRRTPRKCHHRHSTCRAAVARIAD
jgi:hypothetical protein